MTFLIHLGTQEGYVLHYYLTFILEVLISALNCKKNTNIRMEDILIRRLDTNTFFYQNCYKLISELTAMNTRNR